MSGRSPCRLPAGVSTQSRRSRRHARHHAGRRSCRMAPIGQCGVDRDGQSRRVGYRRISDSRTMGFVQHVPMGHGRQETSRPQTKADPTARRQEETSEQGYGVDDSGAVGPFPQNATQGRVTALTSTPKPSPRPGETVEKQHTQQVMSMTPEELDAWYEQQWENA